MIKKIPKALLEIRDVNEFTYLASSRCINTTRHDRATMVKQYCNDLDPDFQAEDAESFRMFAIRIISQLEYLKLMI